MEITKEQIKRAGEIMEEIGKLEEELKTIYGPVQVVEEGKELK